MSSESLEHIKVPRHVAVIMDGNGRWAKERGLPRLAGHKAGADAVDRVIQACIKYKVEYLTLFSFSTENWGRSSDEVNGLMELFRESLSHRLKDLISGEIRLRVVGDLSRLPSDVQSMVDASTASTENCGRLNLTLAMSYGAREEILSATKSLASKVAAGEIDVESIDHDYFEKFLWTKDLPDPDLLIRSSGEMRVSNFLLWQIAYTEIIVTPEYWPDFNEEIIHRSLIDYSKRERRFGKTSEQLETKDASVLNLAQSAL